MSVCAYDMFHLLYVIYFMPFVFRLDDNDRNSSDVYLFDMKKKEFANFAIVMRKANLDI